MSIRDLLVGALVGSVISLTVALNLKGSGDATVSELSVSSHPSGATALANPASDAALSVGSPPAQMAAQPISQPQVLLRSATRASAAVDLPQSAAGLAPPAISTEHAKLLFRAPNREPITIPELHARFSTEGKDTNWAHDMEMQLRSFLVDAGVESGFEIMSVECRETLCEILAFGNALGAQDRWNAIGAEMTKQPWWTNFRGNATSSSEKNGRTVIATLLHRARQ